MRPAYQRFACCKWITVALWAREKTSCGLCTPPFFISEGISGGVLLLFANRNVQFFCLATSPLPLLLEVSTQQSQGSWIAIYRQAKGEVGQLQSAKHVPTTQRERQSHITLHTVDLYICTCLGLTI